MSWEMYDEVVEFDEESWEHIAQILKESGPEIHKIFLASSDGYWERKRAEEAAKSLPSK